MKKATAFVLSLIVCFYHVNAIAAPPGFAWGSLGAFVPLLLICLILLILFLIFFNKGHNKENKILWLNWYTYVSLPISILILIGLSIKSAGVEGVFAAILAIYFCFVLYGLYNRRLWGWVGNWIILGMPISLALLDLLALGKNLPAQIGSILANVMGSLIWFLPNYIYFKKRRFLFECKVPVMEADIVVPKETKDDRVEHPNKSVESVEKKDADIIPARKEAKLGNNEPMVEEEKRQNEKFPYEAELQRRAFAQLLKEERDEATMLQAKVMCDGDTTRVEPSYYKLRYQQMVESGDIENLKRQILKEKRQQE